MHGQDFLPPGSYFQHQVVLRPKHFAYAGSLGSYSRSQLSVEEMDWAFGETIYRFATQILSGKTVTETQRATVKVPASWWQHLKKTAGDWHAAWVQKPHAAWRLFILLADVIIVPAAALIPWFLRRHPVRYAELVAEVRFSRDTLYPGADVSLPHDRFGAPVMYETIQIGHDHDYPAVSGPWELEDYGPARFLERREIISEVMRSPEIASRGMGSFGGADYGSVLGVLDWLGQHGVSVDQLVARSAL